MCFDEKELFLDMCTDFSLVRNGKTIKTSIKGFFCDNRYPHSIQVLYDYGIQPEDCLIHEKSRMRYIIDEVLPVTDNEYILHYRSPADAPASSISIGTISGNAIVGNQQNANLSVGLSAEEIRLAIEKLEGASAEDREKLLALAASVSAVRSAGLVERFAPILAAMLHPITAWLLPNK